MEKTLGGDRLGAGKKMKVDLHNYGRSTHDLGYLFRTTMSAGTLVPFMSEVALPGDTFDIDLQCDIKTHPTVGPLFGSLKVQLDIFLAPIRLYQGQLHNNKLGIGMAMSQVKLPIMQMAAPEWDPSDLQTIIREDIDNSQINPSCILAYLGLRGIGVHVQGIGLSGVRSFNATSLLSYWDIVKNYYSNKQEEIGAVIHTEGVVPDQNVAAILIDGVPISQFPAITPLELLNGSRILINLAGPSTQLQGDITFLKLSNQQNIIISGLGTLIDGGIGQMTELYEFKFNTFGRRTALNWLYHVHTDVRDNEISITTFPLANIDQMRELIMQHTVSPLPFEVIGQGVEPYSLVGQFAGTNMARMHSQEGLALKTYNSDLFNNWLQTDWIDGIDGITAITAIDTSGGNFTIDTLNLSKKVYDMLNRIMVSGGTYDDWQDAVWTHDRHIKAETPMYMGGLIKELVFQEVVSNSEVTADGTEGNQPLGTLAGKGILSKKHKGGKVTIRVDEPSYIIGIVSITPRLDYSQGNSWDLHLKTMDDFHKPALDEIGFQELITEQMAWWDTHQDSLGDWITKSAGKQPAWINYMTNVNRVRGNFAIPNNEMFMVLNRRYEADSNVGFVTIKDLTTYIDPRKFNHMFAETALDSQNYWVQIAADISARRKISAKIMPNL